MVHACHDRMRAGIAIVGFAFWANSGCLLVAAGVVEASRKPLTGNAEGDPAETHDEEESVVGSDGTHGWRNVGDSAPTIAQIRATCNVEAEAPNELRASCNGTPILMRQDGSSVLRLCPQSVEKAACAAVWQSVSR